MVAVIGGSFIFISQNSQRVNSPEWLYHPKCGACNSKFKEALVIVISFEYLH